MEILELNLSEDNRKLDFIIDPEDAFLELRATGSGNNSPKEKNKRLFASVKITVKKNGIDETEETIDLNNQEDHHYDRVNKFLPKVDSPSFERVTIELLEGNTIKDYRLTFNVKKGFKQIDMRSPFDGFHAFMSNRINSKILFSAPFGSGKSTFLEYYFKERTDEYNLFTLYPVNYSVASNEDIFKYIKADILLQLLATDVEFDKESISFIQATEEYIYFKPKEAILSFLDKVSSINPKTSLLRKALGKLNLLAKEIKEYQKEQEINDKDKAIEFIRDIYEKEGSLFEDNFFTQLIRQLLGQLKAASSKQNVLIIEDLDRMDPDHIFRILNVISAHYDTFKFSDEDVFPNKFGFDKILIVCDLKNIQSIYHHKYGAETEFRGYIDKYFSSKPFEFSNLNSIKKYLEKTVQEINNKRHKDPRIDAYGTIIKILLETDGLTLREMLKLMSGDFENFSVNYPTNSSIEYGSFYKILCFLIDLYGSETLKRKFFSIENKVFKTKANFDEVSLQLLAGLGKPHTESPEKIISLYDRHYYHISYSEHINYPIFINLKRIESDVSLVNSGSTKKIKFVKADFVALINKTIDEITLIK